MKAVENADEKNIVTYGNTPDCDFYPENISYTRGAYAKFDICHKGENICTVQLAVPGEHNVRNALAAAAAAIQLGISANAVKYGLAGFQGAGRRFEFKGRFQGADLYDDYAHHPSELAAVLDAVESLDYERVIVVFQPHTYSRTKALFAQFVEQLRRPTITYLAEIFAAREQNTIGISSADLAKEIPNARFFPSFAEIENTLRDVARPGDIILTVAPAMCLESASICWKTRENGTANSFPNFCWGIFLRLFLASRCVASSVSQKRRA
jgi:UDP-N-acetylmuramate--alanine ligase